MKDGNEQTPSAKKPKYKKSTDLHFSSYDGQPLAALEHIWPGSLGLLARRSQLYDKVSALAQLPSLADLPKILQISQRENIPSILIRADLSRLEINASALICALANSSRDRWIELIDKFLDTLNLAEELRGRPHVEQTQSVHFFRGLQIDRVKEKLEPGFQVIKEAKHKGRLENAEMELDAALKSMGYDEKERAALTTKRTLQGAAIKYFCDTMVPGQIVDEHAIQNSYAKYKRALRAQPAGQPS